MPLNNLNLFALTRNPAQRLARFRLSQDVQVDLDTLWASQEQSFEQLSANQVAFDGKYKPDDHEVLVIDTFDDIEGMCEAIKNPLGVVEISSDPARLAEIKAVFSGHVKDGTATVLIQHFDRRRIISTAGLSIFHQSNVFKKIDGSGLSLDSRLVATLTGKTLRFQSFHAVRQIFDMSAYYREATDADIKDFAALPAIKVDDVTAVIAAADNWVRRKLWTIRESKILETVPMTDIKTVAAEFKIPMPTAVVDGQEKIVLPTTKAQLKNLLRFLDEDYYKSPLSKQPFVTNSKKPFSAEPA